MNSSEQTLRPGDFYFIGFNPGGAQAGTPTLAEEVNSFGSPQAEALADAYEQKWGPHAAGQHPIQRGAKALFEIFGGHPRLVCCSNLIFLRSPKASGAGYPGNADICWPVHQAILDIVRPKVIVPFGFKTYEYVTSKLGAKRIDEIPSGHGKWTCEASYCNSGELILKLPHFSRYHLEYKPKVLRWIYCHVDALGTVKAM